MPTIEQQHNNARKRLEIAKMKQATNIMQSIPDFARDKDETEWSALGDVKTSYSEADVLEMQKQAQKMYITNPSATGIIDTIVNFVIGRDLVITPNTKNKKRIKYWKKFCKINKLDMRLKELVRRSMRDGECFTRFFDNESGEPPLMRFVEPPEIKDSQSRFSHGIQTADNDVEKIVMYHRSWRNEKGNSGTEEIPAKEMLHTKIRVDSNVKRGISFLVGISKYIVKYDDWLEDRILLNKIRTMFNLVVKVNGIAPTDFTGGFDDDTTSTPTGDEQLKRMPKPGSVLVATPNIDYEMKSLEIKAQDTKDDGRAIELQIAKGTGLTEYIVRGDASNSNYSSTMVAESPMVRMFQSWQDFFEKVFNDLFEHVMRSYFDSNDGVELKDEEFECSINFPELIARSLKDDTVAYNIHRQNRWASSKTISERLGYNYEDEQKIIEEEDKKESGDEFYKRSGMDERSKGDHNENKSETEGTKEPAKPKEK